ncbi:unnamed protein product [Lasius platythorax]|uniref:Uncharacterized protein n=1 Tax=Lasius platythorax TaxID=488582 RepID=A0AAV2N8M0_9HYME
MKDDQSCDNLRNQRWTKAKPIGTSVTESALRGGSTRTEPTASSPTLGDPLIISLPLHLASSRSSSSSPYIINLLRRSKREVTLCNCDAFVEVVYINDSDSNIELWNELKN